MNIPIATLNRLGALHLKPAAMREVLSIITEILTPIEERRAADRKRKIRGKSTESPAENPQNFLGNSVSFPAENPDSVSPTPPLSYLSSLLTSSEVLEKKEEVVIAHARSESCASVFDEQFWPAYPKRKGNNPRHPAKQKFIALVKSGVSAEAMIIGAKNYARNPATEIGTPFVKQAVVWLNQRGWEDYPNTSTATVEQTEEQRRLLEEHRRECLKRTENAEQEEVWGNTGMGQVGASLVEKLRPTNGALRGEGEAMGGQLAVSVERSEREIDGG